MFQKLLRYEALLIASTPLLGYLILTTYYAAMADTYQITIGAGSPNLMYSVSLGIIIAILLLIAFALSSWLASLIPAKKSPWWWRIKRIAQVLFFLWFAVYFGVGLDNDYPLSELYLGISIITLPVIAALAFMELAWPLIKHRKVKSKTKRLAKQTKNEIYYTSSSYIRYLFRGTRIVLLLIPLLIILMIAQNKGTSAASPTKPHTYMIIESTSANDKNTQQIVLINYGSSWLVAEYDDSYPGKPAYRKKYQLITYDRISDYTITSKYVPYLYVYND